MLQQIAQDLTAQDVALTGVVQINYEYDPDRRCHMDLQILGQSDVIRISQERGKFARGCRLDAGQLAQAVHHVETALAAGKARLLIINKFGQQEADGSGFRDVIGTALAQGTAVLTTVQAGHLKGFRDFAQGLATELPPARDAIVAWCLAQTQAPQQAAQ